MVRITALAAACVGAVLSAAPAAADAQADRMAAAYQDWATRWSVQNSSFAVMRGAKVATTSKVGAGDPRVAAPLASLSKAITGVCVGRLVEKGKLSYGARIGRVLKAYFKANPPADPAAKDVTVAELLTHSSGLAYDPTQGTAEFSALDFSKPNLDAVVALALSRPLSGKSYFYNNAGYAALGLVIEATAKKPYETACAELVLDPAGVKTGRMDPDWRIMSSWGGWNLSAVDYARFLDHFRPGSKLMKTRPPAWAKFDLGGGASYSLGTLLRQTSSGKYNFWHSGAWSWWDSSRPERQENYGSYFVVMYENLRYVATYSPQPSGGAIGDLDAAMWRAAYPTATAADAPALPAAPPASLTNRSDDGAEDIAIGRSQAGR